MKEDMEKKLDELLSGQPRPAYDLDAWLVEDETETFDRLVRQRRRTLMLWRWGAVLAVAASVALLAVLVWPRPETDDPVLAKTEVREAVDFPLGKVPLSPGQSPTFPRGKSQPAPASSKSGGKSAMKAVPAGTVRPERQTGAADSLEYYISKVEQGLQAVRESCYVAHVERLIRADDRLQRLVNQMILDGIIADTDETAILY